MRAEPSLVNLLRALRRARLLRDLRVNLCGLCAEAECGRAAVSTKKKGAGFPAPFSFRLQLRSELVLELDAVERRRVDVEVRDRAVRALASDRSVSRRCRCRRAKGLALDAV